MILLWLELMRKANHTLISDYHGRHMFSNPSMVLKLGHLLVKLALLKIGLGIRTRDKEQRKDAKAFLALHKGAFTDALASAALSSQKQMGNTLLDFPDEDDLRKLKSYQESLAVTLTEKLVNNPDVTTWRELAEIVLSRLLVFNGRRGSEVAQLLVKDYTHTQKSNTPKSLEATFNPVEVQLMNRFVKTLSKK